MDYTAQNNEQTIYSRNQLVGLIDYDLIKRTASDSLLDERLVTREIYWNIFSAILIAVMIIIVMTLGWPAVFIFCGLSALAILLIK